MSERALLGNRVDALNAQIGDKLRRMAALRVELGLCMGTPPPSTEQAVQIHARFQTTHAELEYLRGELDDTRGCLRVMDRSYDDLGIDSDPDTDPETDPAPPPVPFPVPVPTLDPLLDAPDPGNPQRARRRTMTAPRLKPCRSWRATY